MKAKDDDWRLDKRPVYGDHQRHMMHQNARSSMTRFFLALMLCLMMLANETCLGFLQQQQQQHYRRCCETNSMGRRVVAAPSLQRHNTPYTWQQANTLLHGSSSREEDYDYDDDDDEPPDVGDVSQFKAPTTSFGWNKGRSSPSQRKAMGRSGSETARVHICTTCGSEFVKWMGRCPTCKEWNTLQEHVVTREPQPSSFGLSGGGAAPRPSFGTAARPASWLDGLGGEQAGDFAVGNKPIRITDLYQKSSSGDTTEHQRPQRIEIPADEELNTVLGGGIMQGSITLIGGDPGVGKSTLLLQLAGHVASLSTPTPGIGMGPAAVPANSANLGPVWYVSGEENPDQIASRAERLGILESELWLLSETHADTLCEQVVSYYLGKEQNTQHTDEQEENVPRPKPPSLIVIDSIQTIVCNAGGASAAGGVTQVRECVALFLRLAKSTKIPIFLVGHVTKSGDVAGPRTVEHMVDCVLYLEGMMDEGSTNLRMLRASKNRFGSSDEVGVYEMTAGRLRPVSDPSSLFLAHRSSVEDAEGCAIAIVLEGMRAMTVEIQALVVPSGGGGGDGKSGYARRTVDGIAHSRLLLLMGVLQKRGGIMMGRQDVYVNVVGRIRLDRGEGNAGDLAVAVALVSSLTSIPVRADTAFFGAVDLSGDLREVQAVEKRLQEARRMGFSRVVSAAPRRVSKQKGRGSRSLPSPVNGIEWVQCETLVEAINAGLVRNLPKRRYRKTKPSPKKGSSVPGELQDLGLEIIDDDDDDDDEDLLDSFA